jgi:small subunit ribosomal protein S17
MMAQEQRKSMVGRVVSDKMAKTVTVEVSTRTKHRLYGKIITRTHKFKAHNEEPLAKLGDTVKIVESRPLSATKRWRVAEIVRRGDVVEAIHEKELESLLEKERAEKEARKAEERRRAQERLAQLAGEGGMAPEEEAEEVEEAEAETVEEAEEEAE